MAGEHDTSIESSDSAELYSPLSMSPVKEKKKLKNLDHVPKDNSNSIRSSINAKSNLIIHPDADKDIKPLSNFAIIPKMISTVKKIGAGLGVKRALSKGSKKIEGEIVENDYNDAKV